MFEEAEEEEGPLRRCVCVWWAKCVLCVCVCVCVEGVYVCLCGGGSVCVVSVCGDYIHGFRIDDLGWEGYNKIIDSHQCPHPVRAPASRVHCCHMMHP